METPETKRPYPEDDLLNASVYDVAKDVDRILNRCSVQDHAAIIGIIQCTGARRANEHQQREQKKQAEAMEEMQRRQAQSRLSIQ